MHNWRRLNPHPHRRKRPKLTVRQADRLSQAEVLLEQLQCRAGLATAIKAHCDQHGYDEFYVLTINTLLTQCDRLFARLDAVLHPPLKLIANNPPKESPP